MGRVHQCALRGCLKRVRAQLFFLLGASSFMLLFVLLFLANVDEETVDRILVALGLGFLVRFLLKPLLLSALPASTLAWNRKQLWQYFKDKQKQGEEKERAMQASSELGQLEESKAVMVTRMT